MSINLAQLKQQQLEYASRIVLQDDMTLSNVEKVAGADVGFEDGGNITRAAIVILSYPTLELIEYHCAKLPTTIPYIPGYLSFRECPALLSAWDKVVHKPQLLLVDGQGVAHPRRLGVACHLGLLLDLPTIGVAKTKLYGEYEPLSDLQLASQPLFDKANKEQIGNVLRSKQRCNPLFISAGHRITQASALNWVKSCLLGYRLPEPTRFADAVASNKPLMQKLHNEKNETKFMTEFKKNGFTFKHFFVAHDKSPMKVTTDSCLLGAWSPITENTKAVLDIGCGCGIIALMLAQRLAGQSSQIDAIDIDHDAIMQCRDNIEQSPFNCIATECIDVNQYAYDRSAYYDLIVTNPPYFQTAVECRNQRRQSARYTDNLDHQQLVNVVKRLLKPSGRFCVVLPYHLIEGFINLCVKNKLYLVQQLNVNYSEDKTFSLALLCFTSVDQHPSITQSLCMRDTALSYTQDFRQLLKDFYLFNK